MKIMTDMGDGQDFIMINWKLCDSIHLNQEVNRKLNNWLVEILTSAGGEG